MIDAAIECGIEVRPPRDGMNYVAFTNASVGSSDDFSLSRAVLEFVHESAAYRIGFSRGEQEEVEETVENVSETRADRFNRESPNRRKSLLMLVGDKLWPMSIVSQTLGVCGLRMSPCAVATTC